MEPRHCSTSMSDGNPPPAKAEARPRTAATKEHVSGRETKEPSKVTPGEPDLSISTVRSISFSIAVKANRSG